VHKTQPLCTYFLLNCTKFRQGSSSYLRQHLHKLWLAASTNKQSYMVQRHRVTDCLLNETNWQKLMSHTLRFTYSIQVHTWHVYTHTYMYICLFISDPLYKNTKYKIHVIKNYDWLIVPYSISATLSPPLHLIFLFLLGGSGKSKDVLAWYSL